MKMTWASELTTGEHAVRGPFATVSMDVSRDDSAGGRGREVGVRWADHARRLAELGAPAAVVEALAGRVTGPTGQSGKLGRLTVANAGGVVLDLILPEPPVRESTLWGPVPQLLPVARALSGRLSYVVAEIDSAGAEIRVVTPWGEAARQQVDGDHDELHRVPGGGWSQRRYQKRVEDSVARNAEEVARELNVVVREQKPDLVFVGGEDHSVTDLLKYVEGGLRDRVVRLKHGRRGAGAGDRNRDEEIAAAMAKETGRRQAELLDRFAGAQARQDGAAQSVDDVVTALQRGQVEEVLLVDTPSSPLTLWATGRPEQLALAPSELKDMGAEGGEQTRADAAIVWAAAGSGAGLTLFADLVEDPLDDAHDRPRPPQLRDGIGAVLRWSDESTARDGAPSMPGHGEGPGARRGGEQD
jgi:hypothetical protein